ncbi:unnamed protein product [Rhizophagus irregularis]|nr:unnamed protein product [Rhizophagus irregularis]
MTLYNSMKSFKKRLLKKKLRLSNNTQKIITDAEIREINSLESSNDKYDYSNFEKIQYIGRGSSGSVVRANLKDKVYALKYFNNDKTTIRKVNKELQLHKIFNHKNILQFHGYTIIDTDPVYQINKYCLVLEYADSVNAVSCLHEQDIIHRDLHSNNILVHQKTIKLSDFGLSTKETPMETTKETMLALSLAITNGKREEVIEDTPVVYSNLYSDCWKFDPNERPDIQQVASLLDRLINNNSLTVEQSKNLQKSTDTFDDSRELYLNSIESSCQENYKINTSIPSKVIYKKRKIYSKDLTSPIRGKPDDKRGKDPNFVIRKIYKGQEVACKYISNDEKKERFFEFLMELSECKHINRFHGTSTIEDRNVMVFEWAERGTLRHLYEQKEIKWHYKVRIALNICRGLIFLQVGNILHHDLRCQNILITESLEPKICNFELAHYSDRNGNSSSLSIDQATAVDALPWLAPEMLTTFRYTPQCEIFSFGMLLWELAFEKIPYQGWEVKKIKEHVINGGRERFTFGDSTPKIYQEYKKMIRDSWKQEPQERTSFVKLLDMLEELHDSIRYMFDDHSLDLPDKAMDSLDDDDDDDDLELPDEDTSPVSINPLEKSFKNTDQKLWECFEFQNNDISELNAAVVCL